MLRGERPPLSQSRSPRSSGFSQMCGMKIGTGRQPKTSCGQSVETQRRKDPDRSAPLTYNLVDRICSQAEAEAKNPLAGLRDSAIIRLMSDCLLRVSEVAAVNCGDLKDNTLTIRQSKTDQLGEGRVLFVGDETVQVIEELKAKTDISRGALFRRVLKNGKMTTTRLTPEAIREIVKKRSQGIRGSQRSGVEAFASCRICGIVSAW